MAFKTEKQAQEHCNKVLAILDPDCDGNWQGRVWDNLGWHCCWKNGAVNLHYEWDLQYYWAMVGSLDDSFGHNALTADLEPTDDPKEAIRLACDYAIDVFEKEWKPIQLSVAQVRLSL